MEMYWLEVLDSLKTFMYVVAVVSSALIFVCVVEASKSEDSLEGLRSIFNILLVVVIVAWVAILFLPSNNILQLERAKRLGVAEQCEGKNNGKI